VGLHLCIWNPAEKPVKTIYHSLIPNTVSSSPGLLGLFDVGAPL
jgi:hypothetical protein